MVKINVTYNNYNMIITAAIMWRRW